MKYLLLSCLLTTCFIYSADESCFIVRFKDSPGKYRVKIEMVKNVKFKDQELETYDSLATYTEDYKQKRESESLVMPYITIPEDATHLRISVRTGENFKKGWRKYLSISKLREEMAHIKPDKKSCPAIKIENQFQHILNRKPFTYTIESDSVYNVD